jgi:ketosteroid isomerase-like protein
MSQENVEFVKGLFAAGASMDKQALLAALPDLIAQTCDPEIEWVEDPQRADGRVYRGHEGVRESWERWLENFDEWGFEVERISDHGNRVLVVAVEHGRGSVSEAEVSARNYMVFTLRAGKILRYQEFYDEAYALEAVGLREEAGGEKRESTP